MIESILIEFKDKIDKISQLEEIKQLEILYLGENSWLSSEMKNLSSLALQEQNIKKVEISNIKTEIEKLIREKYLDIKAQQIIDYINSIMPATILEELKEEIDEASQLEEIQQIKIHYLGKKSWLSSEMKNLSSLSLEDKKIKGAEINSLRLEIEKLINDKFLYIKEKILIEKLQKEKVDITIPIKGNKKGSIHPITQATEELIQVFSQFGFTIKTGTSVETDWYNFTALNIDKHHPARQMHDTFYLENNLMLRTHTSSTQIRTMENEKPPLRIISPGRTYRSDSDMTHSPMFHQIEGLVIDKDINMGHLKYIIIEFLQIFFEQPNIEIRFRPSFFPFTEPSAEVDIRLNKNQKWLEVLGCGMTHPAVLSNCNIDPNIYKAFAFGLGIERLAMLKYGITDLRNFFDGDIRWLKHYNFAALDIPTLFGGLTK